MDLKAQAKAIEKILLPRLRKMGLVLIIFAAISLAYGLFFIDENLDADDPEEEALENPPPNYYAITATFIVVGAGLIAYVARRKQKS